MASTGGTTPSCSTLADTIDLTQDETKDYLTRLPSELQQHIIGYLFPTHEPDIAFLCEDGVVDKSEETTHPLDYLAATCKSMRSEVMDFARAFLTKHSDITKYKTLKTAKKQAQRNLLRGRTGLLTWAQKNCVFCGKKSVRLALLMNGLHCCSNCDKEQWPDKITRTDAKNEYDLQDNQLFPSGLPSGNLSPSLTKLLSNHPGGFPTPRYGTYISQNVPCTLFLRKDVEKLAHFAHGDLKAHLQQRQADREARREKAREKKEKREAKEALDAQEQRARAPPDLQTIAHERDIAHQEYEAFRSQEPPTPDASHFWEILQQGITEDEMFAPQDFFLT